MRRAASLATAAAAAIAVAGCSNILGLQDLQPYPGDGGADGPTSGEGGSDDATSSDGPAGDDGAKPADGSPEGAAEGGADASCTNTSSDPHNCGACGHDCLGGSCAGGQCSPVVLANVAAVDIVVVGSTAFWVDGAATNGSLWSCDVTSCSATQIKGGFADPGRIAYDGSGTIFWTVRGSGTTSDGSVWAYDLVKKTATEIASARATPEGIAADASYVYWAEDFGTQNQVLQYARSTSSLTAISTGVGSGPYSVALASGELYVAEGGNGNIARCTEGSCTPAAFEIGQGTPLAIWVDSTWVYWTDYGSAGAVSRADIGSGTVHPLASLQANPVRIVSDAADVYWTDYGTMASDGSLVGCAQPSCSTPTPLVTGLQTPVGLAIDATAIYYGTTGDSRLRKLAR